MSRPAFNEHHQLLGVSKAIAALRRKKAGPIWLLPSLEKRKAELERKLGVGKSKKSARGFLSGVFPIA